MKQDKNLFWVQYEDMETPLNVSRNTAGDIMIDLYINEEFVESNVMIQKYILNIHKNEIVVRGIAVLGTEI